MIARHGSGRRFAARLGLFTVLFQAILFGWHHHELTFGGRAPVPGFEKPAAAPQAVDDEDGCEICQVLHHLTATPVAFVIAPRPFIAAAAAAPRDAAFLVRTAALAFRARAPPLA